MLRRLGNHSTGHPRVHASHGQPVNVVEPERVESNKEPEVASLARFSGFSQTGRPTPMLVVPQGMIFSRSRPVFRGVVLGPGGGLS
jgi:hypothetical protein